MRISPVSIIIFLGFLANLRYGLSEDYHEYQIDFDNIGEPVRNFWYSTGKVKNFQNGEKINTIHE